MKSHRWAKNPKPLLSHGTFNTNMKHNALLQLQVDNLGLEEGERGERGRGRERGG